MKTLRYISETPPLMMKIYLTRQFSDDPSGAKALWSRGNLNGASQKAETVANFFVGDMITAIQVCHRKNTKTITFS